MAPAADQQPDPAPASATVPRRRTMGFAAQELRLISALVVILAIGLFLALPFVLSIGAVVFLPLVSAMVLTILLSPLADKLAGWGLPNTLASLLSMVVMVAVILLALTAVLSPAIALYDDLPQMIATVGERFSELRGNLSWLARLNDQIAGVTGGTSAREVVLASPSLLEKVAVATPTVVLELLLTIMMTFFMVESRVRLRRRLVLQRQQLDASLKAARVMRAVQDRVAAYILTVGVINLGVGVIVTLGAWAMGVTAPLMWGGLAALLNFVPYIGPLAMVALLALFGIGTAESPVVGLIPAAAYLGLHTIESNVVTPAVLGARFTMNPVMILLALSYFSWIWGVAGALLSVPLLLALTALVDHLGKPNLIGFLFGEPLFANNLLDLTEGD